MRSWRQSNLRTSRLVTVFDLIIWSGAQQYNWELLLLLERARSELIDRCKPIESFDYIFFPGWVSLLCRTSSRLTGASTITVFLIIIILSAIIQGQPWSESDCSSKSWDAGHHHHHCHNCEADGDASVVIELVILT